MPKITQENTKPVNFAFSRASIEDIKKVGSSEWTLVVIDCDVSGSTSGFRDQMEKLLKAIITGCSGARSNNLLIKVNKFGTGVQEVHGFMLYNSIALDIYDGCLTGNGRTALLDSICAGEESIYVMGEELVDDHDYDVNAIHIIITDGYEYGSVMTYDQAQKELARTRTGECLESNLSLVIRINEGSAGSDESRDKLVKIGIDEVIDAGNFDEDAFKKITGFVSQSITTQSQAVGSGAASQVLTFS